MNRELFTGATGANLGLMESAPGGTLFLDEIGECSSRAKLSSYASWKLIKSVTSGALLERYLNVRIIAATNRKWKKI
jgi:transcriptional regulator with PAS, ATPase and Fis domain